MRDGLGPEILPASDAGSLAAAAAAMRSGGIVGMPTETVYGIGVVPRPGPLRAVIAAKQRVDDKGIALLVDGLDQVAGLVIVSAAARQLAERFWPGPLTLVLPVRRDEVVPEALTGGRGTLGVRIPDHAVPRGLARQLGPIAVTSANRSGEPEARTARELVDAFGASLALVLDDGPVRGGVASTVVAVGADGAIRMLREGALGEARIESVLGGD